MCNKFCCVDPSSVTACIARSHSLSSHNPACTHCGLPLCILNLPIYCCPSCASPLLSPSALQAMVARVSDELDQTLQKEEEARQRVVAERQRIEGGFPTLGAAAANAAQPQTHKVMSLKGSRITVSKVRATPPSSGPASRAQTPSDLEADMPKRVPAPSNEVLSFSISPQNLANRPWFNARESLTYVEPARI